MKLAKGLRDSLKAPPLEKTPEELIKATTWWEGFLHGREEGYRVGLKLGITQAIKILESKIEESKSDSVQI